MFRFCTLFLAAWIFGLATPAQAQTAGDDADVLRQSQEMLTNKAQRDAAIKDNPDAKRLDLNLQEMAGTKDSEEIYKISAEVLADLIKQTGGDPAKAMQMLQEAQKDPEHFGQNLSEDKRRRIREIAGRIEAAQKTMPK